MSQPNLNRLVVGRVSNVTGMRRIGARWHVAAARHGERERWETNDGRWVAVAAGHGASEGKAVVADSRGRFEAVDTFDDALALARSWRT